MRKLLIYNSRRLSYLYLNFVACLHLGILCSYWETWTSFKVSIINFFCESLNLFPSGDSKCIDYLKQYISRSRLYWYVTENTDGKAVRIYKSMIFETINFLIVELPSICSPLSKSMSGNKWIEYVPVLNCLLFAEYFHY